MTVTWRFVYWHWKLNYFLLKVELFLVEKSTICYGTCIKIEIMWLQFFLKAMDQISLYFNRTLTDIGGFWEIWKTWNEKKITESLKINRYKYDLEFKNYTLIKQIIFKIFDKMLILNSCEIIFKVTTFNFWWASG